MSGKKKKTTTWRRTTTWNKTLQGKKKVNRNGRDGAHFV